LGEANKPLFFSHFRIDFFARWAGVGLTEGLPEQAAAMPFPISRNF